MILWWTPEAAANDCDYECFEIAAWSECRDGMKAEITGPAEVELFFVLFDSQLGSWTLTRDDAALFDDRTFDPSEAVAEDRVTSGDCSSSLGLAFVVSDEGLALGTHRYTLENEASVYEAEVTFEAEDEPGCGCGTAPLPGVLLGLTMVGAGAALGRRPNPGAR
jgi:hypothetical protein